MTENVQTLERDAPPARGNGGEETISDRKRQARELIEIGPHGLDPKTYAQWVDIADDMVRNDLMLPEHLRGNKAAFMGIIQVSARSRLEPLLVSAHTYIQSGRLCFDAQLFGAILYRSGLLLGRLRFEYSGEGDEMRCNASGRFKDDPGVWVPCLSPPVKQIHPGRVTKEDKTFVRGSQLWDKFPEQQLAYYMIRAWTRRHAPDAILGMFTREEIMEMDEAERARQAIDVSGLAQRLESGRLDTGEGFSIPEAQIPAEEPDRTPPARPARAEAAEPAREIKPPARPKQPARAKTSPRPPARPQKAKPKAQPPSPARIKAAADRAEARSAATKKAAEPGPAAKKAEPAPEQPKTSARARSYIEATMAWIATVDPTDKEAAMAQWDAEWDARDEAGVSVADRLRLKQQLDARFEP